METLPAKIEKDESSEIWLEVAEIMEKGRIFFFFFSFFFVSNDGGHRDDGKGRIFFLSGF